MEGIKFFKIIFNFSFLLLTIFFISCQSPIFQTPYQAKNDLADYTNYHGQYISKNVVGQNNEKLNVNITTDIIIWIGGPSFPTEEYERFTIYNADIDGEFPHYAFNNDEVVGRLSIVNSNVITVTFAKLFPPSLNIQNIACNKYNLTANN